MKNYIFAIFPFILILTSACGTTDGEGDKNYESAERQSAHGSIGPEGGTISSPDGFILLNVPPGALENETNISIEPISDAGHPWAVPGTVYSFEPEGLLFSSDAKLTILYEPELINASDPEQGLGLFKIDNEDWNALESIVHVGDNSVSAPISSFSRYGIRAVIPKLKLEVGFMQQHSLIPFFYNSIVTSACHPQGCVDVEEKIGDSRELGFNTVIKLFTESNDSCGFLDGSPFRNLDFAMVSTPQTNLDGEGGNAVTQIDSFNGHEYRAGFNYILNSFAEPVYRNGHNTRSTVLSTLSFFRLDEIAPNERSLVLDIYNPGGVTFDLAIAWLLEGGSAGILTPHVQASSEVVLHRCGESWQESEKFDLFSAVASPISTPELEEAGVIRISSLSDPRLQLWIGLHIQARALSVYGDDEGTVGYGLIDGGQSAADGSFAFVVEIPQQ